MAKTWLYQNQKCHLQKGGKTLFCRCIGWLSSEADGVHLPGRQQCIFGHNHQLQNREASFIVFALCSPVKRFVFFTGCVALEPSDRCNSTGYPITAVYSRVRLAFHSLDRRSLSASVADMLLQQLRSVCSLYSRILCLYLSRSRTVS